MKHKTEEKHECSCPFCQANRALDEILARAQDADTPVEAVRQTLDGMYSELFDDQFELDRIASRLGIQDAIGVTSDQVLGQIEALKKRLTAAELEVAALRATPLEHLVEVGKLSFNRLHEAATAGRPIAGDYDAIVDTLLVYLCERPAEVVVHFLDDRLGLLYDAASLEVVGLQIDALKLRELS